MFRDAFFPTDVDMWTGVFESGRSNVAAYVEQAQRLALGEIEFLVPTDTFWVFSGDEMAGELHVRHYLRRTLLRHGGHIGYSVQPKFRSRGVATAILRFGLGRLRELGEADAVVTCDDENYASARVIEKCGGVRIPDSEVNGRPHRRYLVPV
ncbi:MAG TPA: GNAT family N-acetyltransferase [Candidatus Tyrphobacter sp.]